MTEELGNYETSFFIMNVPTKADLEIRDMADEDFAIFFHEYSLLVFEREGAHS